MRILVILGNRLNAVLTNKCHGHAGKCSSATAGAHRTRRVEARQLPQFLFQRFKLFVEHVGQTAS
jgi:hypothetical protein